MNEIEISAERNVLGALAKSPERFFSATAILTVQDFCDQTCRCIYRSIKSVFEEDPGATEAIDSSVLEHRVATVAPEYYARSATEIKETIEYVLESPELKDRDFKAITRVVVKNSVLRRATDKLERVKQDLPGCQTHEDILAHMEKEVCGFTTQAVTRTDIVVMGDGYERFVLRREEEALAGNLHIGITTGFPMWDAAIGGGMRDGTMHIVAARSKMGKSWCALKVGDNVASLGIPVLYLDTELEDNFQSDRRVAQRARIPMYAIERALYLKDPNMKARFSESRKVFQEHPIMYVDVKGWSIDRIISAIRKFYAQYVGKKMTVGGYEKGLVIYDYLKLMRSSDKGQDKEYEALGYRMTLLHDLMGEYNNPMVAPAQQNRDGMDKMDESTVSGSDRIVHLCDSFSIMAQLNDAELMARHAQVADFGDIPVPGADGNVIMKKPVVYNMKFKIPVCRQGPGTPGDSYIATYMDIKDRAISYKNVCGHIEMGHVCRLVRDNEGKQGGAGSSKHSAKSAGGGTP